MWTDFVPIFATGIATMEVVVLLQRQGLDVYTKIFCELIVHLMLCQPKGEHSRLASKVVNLQTIELADVDDATIHELHLHIGRHTLDEF